LETLQPSVVGFVFVVFRHCLVASRRCTPEKSVRASYERADSFSIASAILSGWSAYSPL
jgi:hypothetical protein